MKMIKRRLQGRRPNVHLIEVIIGRIEEICLEIMAGILSELMEVSNLQEVN